VTTLDTMHVIEPGDFIASVTMGHVCGLVIEAGFMGNKRLNLRGHRIEMGDGRESFIADDDARLVHKNLDWWDRFVAEIQAGIIVPVFEEAVGS
jgi:hypothetical protein